MCITALILFLPTVSWEMSPCSRRMDMCTAGCIDTWPVAWRSQTDIASQSRSPIHPSPSLWCGFWFFPKSQPRVSNFLSDSPTEILVESITRILSIVNFHSPFQNNGGISSELPLPARAPIRSRCLDSLCTWKHWTAWTLFSRVLLESWPGAFIILWPVSPPVSEAHPAEIVFAVCSWSTACDCGAVLFSIQILHLHLGQSWAKIKG